MIRTHEYGFPPIAAVLKAAKTRPEAQDMTPLLEEKRPSQEERDRLRGMLSRLMDEAAGEVKAKAEPEPVIDDPAAIKEREERKQQLAKQAEGLKP